MHMNHWRHLCLCIPTASFKPMRTAISSPSSGISNVEETPVRTCLIEDAVIDIKRNRGDNPTIPPCQSRMPRGD
jgi:hypothetical protein